MDTQNTPIHIKLWHRDFWRLCFANLLLMSSVYMLIVGIPSYMLSEGYDSQSVGLVLGAYGIGIFLLGGCCSYLVQRYRRNHVCQWAILGVVVCIALFYYLEMFLHLKVDLWMMIAARIVLGACLGLAQMTLASTLIIDTCESFQRTEANYITSWFARFALAIGPVVAVAVGDSFDYKYVFPVAGVTALIAFVLVMRAKFPFKAPAEHLPKWSLDRFFLPQGFPLFVNIVMIMTVVGIILSFPHSLACYLTMMAGMVLAVIAEKYAFADADLKSEVIAGLIMMGAALLVALSHSSQSSIEFFAPALLGLGVGIIGSRFLLFYIKLAKHCQRGTSMSSFFLSWEGGLSLGLFLGFFLADHPSPKVLMQSLPILDKIDHPLIFLCLGIVLVSLLVYNFLVHPWYMKHRNR